MGVGVCANDKSISLFTGYISLFSIAVVRLMVKEENIVVDKILSFLLTMIGRRCTTYDNLLNNR